MEFWQINKALNYFLDHRLSNIDPINIILNVRIGSIWFNTDHKWERFFVLGIAIPFGS